MRVTKLAGLSVSVLLSVSVGCGDDDSSPMPGTDAGVGSDGSMTMDDGATGDASTDPLVLVPPVRLAASAATDCVGSYVDTAPVEGLNRSFTVEGQARAFVLDLPGATFTGPRPIFFAFNGTGENGLTFFDRADLEDFVARGFIVVAPSSNGNGEIWPVWDAMHMAGAEPDPNPDLAYFDKLLRCVAAHYEVDEKRIYVGGHSAGGIMTNYLLQRRSELLAGGIVASGVFSLTSPMPRPTLDPMAVLVTWGGMNDAYSGGSGGVTVPEINFVEQASIASVYYDSEPNIGHARCNGNNFGHAWLDPTNDWMVDYLLAHPKGLPGNMETDLPATPGGSGVTCSRDPYMFTPSLVVECPSADTVCGDTCQMFADCGVENSTVGPILAPQLTMLGFSGPDNRNCGGCVSLCETRNMNAADMAALTCMQTRADMAMCGAGIEGALPVIEALDTCCMGKSDSTFCVETCTAILTNTAARSFFPNCQALVD